mgnify:CR=1 FL=1
MLLPLSNLDMGKKFRQWKGLDSIFIKDYDAVEGNLIHTYIIINCLPLIGIISDRYQAIHHIFYSDNELVFI